MSVFGGLQKHKNTHHARYKYLGLGSTTLLQLAFLGESNPNFPLGQSKQKKFPQHTASSGENITRD